MELKAIGIDLGKSLFHLVGLDELGQVVVRKRCSRTQLLTYTANLKVKRIGMEAGSGSHFLARVLREQGHDVRLMPAQYVKPYVKTNKSDYIDAEAIAEAVQRPTMRFVPIKTEEQLDLQAVHRVRERWVMRRTAVVNQIRGLLLERGLPIPKGRCHLDEALWEIQKHGDARLSEPFLALLSQLKLELDQLTASIERVDGVPQETIRESEPCQRGPVTATALVAAIGNGSAFRRGKDLAAWVGMVPRECSTGGKQKLLGISKCGNRYLRKLFVQAARAVMRHRSKQAQGLSCWLAQLLTRAHKHVVAVALANKLIRMAWAVLCKNQAYCPAAVAAST
jgi:transposase